MLGLRALIGLMIAGLGIFIALMMTGAGHGWIAPFPFSFAMLIAWPLVLVRLASEGERIVVDWGLLIAAVLLDLWLGWVTWEVEPQYFMRALNGGLAYFWLAIWAGWQLLAIPSLVRRMNLRAGLIAPD